MAIKIRLRRMGNRNRPFFRLVAAEESCRRDGRFIDTLGHYDPIPNPHVLEVKEDRVFHWIENGAQMTTAARELLRSHGTLKRWHERKGAAAPAQSDS